MIVFEHVWILALLPLPLVVRKLLPPFEDVRQAVRVP